MQPTSGAHSIKLLAPSHGDQCCAVSRCASVKPMQGQYLDLRVSPDVQGSYPEIQVFKRKQILSKRLIVVCFAAQLSSSLLRLMLISHHRGQHSITCQPYSDGQPKDVCSPVCPLILEYMPVCRRQFRLCMWQAVHAHVSQGAPVA